MATIEEVYRYPWSYACEHGEQVLYRRSMKLNIACKEAIENHYRTNITAPPSGLGSVLVGGTKAAADAAILSFGIERVAYVTAVTVRRKDWDERFSPVNKRWAASIPVFRDSDERDDPTIRFVVNQVHPYMFNDFANEIRNRMQAGG